MADFEISITAAEDNEDEGIIGARGANGGPVEESDYAHIRAWLRGSLLNLEGALPPGWSLKIVSNVEAFSQTVFTGNVRRAQPVELPPDRLDLIETAICAGVLPDESTCGRTIVNQGDGIWVHQELCAEPEPVDV